MIKERVGWKGITVFIIGDLILGTILVSVHWSCPENSSDEYITWTCQELSSEYKKREKLLAQNQKKYQAKDNKRFQKGIEEINFRYQHVQDYPENCNKFIQKKAMQK